MSDRVAAIRARAAHVCADRDIARDIGVAEEPVRIGRCPHGAGPASRCSQCAGAPARRVTDDELRAAGAAAYCWTKRIVGPLVAVAATNENASELSAAGRRGAKARWDSEQARRRVAAADVADALDQGGDASGAASPQEPQ